MLKPPMKWLLAAAALAAMAAPVLGQSDDAKGGMNMPLMSKGLPEPMMDPAAGRKLFASKGCVVCHSVNGTGGQDARALDAAGMAGLMNPFDFAASMWQGAEPMVALQREELGGQIELTGQELADITAFIHDPDEQANFSMADVPENIAKLMMKMDGGN